MLLTRAFNRSRALTGLELLAGLLGLLTGVGLFEFKTIQFDSFWHSGLLHQLKSYGISGQIFGLVSSFLIIYFLLLLIITKVYK